RDALLIALVADVSCLEDHAHAALADLLLEQEAVLHDCAGRQCGGDWARRRRRSVHGCSVHGRRNAAVRANARIAAVRAGYEARGVVVCHTTSLNRRSCDCTALGEIANNGRRAAAELSTAALAPPQRPR